MSRRNVMAVVGLCVLTCGLYGFYWMWDTTREIGEVSGEDVNPGIDLLLCILTGGIWGLWVVYRNAQLAHQTLRATGVAHEDSSNTVLLFGALTYVSGFAWVISVAILQTDLNKLAAERTQSPLMPVTY